MVSALVSAIASSTEADKTERMASLRRGTDYGEDLGEIGSSNNLFVIPTLHDTVLRVNQKKRGRSHLKHQGTRRFRLARQGRIAQKRRLCSHQMKIKTLVGGLDPREKP